MKEHNQVAIIPNNREDGRGSECPPCGTKLPQVNAFIFLPKCLKQIYALSRAHHAVYLFRYHTQEILTYFHFLIHILQCQVKDVCHAVYIQCSWLFLFLWEFAAQCCPHIFHAIIALAMAIVSDQIKMVENVL